MSRPPMNHANPLLGITKAPRPLKLCQCSARAMERRGIEMLDHRWPGDLKKWMRENGMDLDHVLIVRPDTALEALPAVIGQTNAVLSYYGVDLHFARLRRQAVLEADPARMEDAAWMERLERKIWRNFDVVIYPSDEEAAVVKEMSPGTNACSIVPFSFDIAPHRTVPIADRSVLFVAGFAHPPNVDAAKFLMLDVIPRLEARVGLVQVTLAGSNPTQEVLDFANESTTVTGYVTDEELSKLYNSHRASIVPLRFGAGVKGKVVESLSYGLPLVTTSIGAQGIVDLDKVVSISDDAEGLAAGLARLLTDDDVWIKQSHAQTAFAGHRFSRSAVQRSVLQALESGELLAAETYRHGSVLTEHES
jgi:glycosyltransferase involved in cell wall biosynthesis